MFASDLKHSNPTLENKLQLLYNLSRGKRMELSFRKPYLELLEKFGNPHLKLPPTIHVAGTNGKGSIIAMLRAMYESAGYRVHAYTSPHLLRFNERIVLAGQDIDDQTLEALIDEALELNEGKDVTFFEITTAMAFAAFSRTPADILLLEVGLGGRLDCTNIIPAPAVCVVHTISHDHMEFLGGTLEEIAAEKCGIMKPKIPCVIGPQTIDSKLFMNFAESQNSPLFFHGAEWSIAPEDQDLIFEFQNEQVRCPLPALPGFHQINNAGSALAAAQLMARILPLNDKDLCNGLKNAKWPGRMQNVTPNFAGLLPPGWDVFYDGGHNEGAAHAIAQHIQTTEDVHLIIGMMAHKSPESFLRSLIPHIKSLTLIDIPGEPHAMKAKDILNDLKSILPPNTTTSPSLRKAVEKLAKTQKPPGRILITGSLYLAAHLPAP